MLIVFWLMPIALLVVLILLVLKMTGEKNRQELMAIEPLGYLVSRWQVARIEPDNQSLTQLFKLLASINLSKGTLLEQVIISAATTVRLKSKTSVATLTEHRVVGPLAEQFILEDGAKKQSVVIGSLEQIRLQIEEETLGNFLNLSRSAEENGYLPLAVASSISHGNDSKRIKHQLEGLVILEPKIDQTNLEAVRKLTGQSVRFLTVLPVRLAQHWYESAYPNRDCFGIEANALLTLSPLKFAEADIEKAQVIGSADLNSRHRILRTWQRIFACTVLSVNPEDSDLPVTPIRQLP